MEYGPNAGLCHLQEYGKEKQIAEPMFYREDKVLYLVKYVEQLWKEALSLFDFKEGVEFKKVIQSVSSDKDTRIIVSKLANIWLRQENSQYTITSNQKIHRN